MSDAWPELVAAEIYAAAAAGGCGPAAAAAAAALEALIAVGQLDPAIRLDLVAAHQRACLERLVAGVAALSANFAAAVDSGVYPPGATWADVVTAAAELVAR
jgi:hypothetical protein